MRKRSPAAERHADLIRVALFEVAPAGMTLPRLMAACELSRWQTRSGIAPLRDVSADHGWPPLIWTREMGYRFCGSEEELEEWERIWLSEKLTQFRRMITGTLVPHLALFPKSAWATYLSAQLTAVESNLEMAAQARPR